VDGAARDVAVCELVAQMCRALGDVTRLRIVRALAEGPQSVGGLGRILDTPQPTVSRHLKVLRDQSVVFPTRHGQSVEYELGDRQVLIALDTLRTVLADSFERRSTAYAEAFGDDATGRTRARTS
jgi:DNA-binding transcriptional ArsR family regulator